MVEIKHEIIDVTAISVLFQSEVEVLIMMIRRTDVELGVRKEPQKDSHVQPTRDEHD